MRSGSSRRRRAWRPSPGEAARASLIALLCLSLAGLAAYHLASQQLSTRTERDWKILAKSKDRQQLQAVVDRAKHALNARPMDVRAASLMAMAKQQLGQSKEAEGLMQAAFKLSRRDTATNLWLYEHNIQQRRFEEAFLNIDAYMRRFPMDSARVMPRVVVDAAQPGAAGLFAKRLAAEPGWRRGFYDTLARLTPDNPDIAFPFMSETMKAGSLPTKNELETHLNRMVAAGRFEEAYLHWILLIPTEQTKTLGYINDADFEGDGGYPPFGWNLAKSPGSTVERAEAFGRSGKALRIGYDGFSKAVMPTQVLLLPPGQYRMAGDFLSEDENSIDRVKWVVACPGASPRALAEQLATGEPGRWYRFTLDFTVPPAGCAAQVAGAAPVTGVRRVPVGVWFDKLSIVRMDTPS